MKKQNCLILIDGSNFYYKLKNLKFQNLSNFNFSDFVKFLAGKNQIVKTNYYIGKVKTDKNAKSKQLHSAQQRLLSSLKKHGIKYSLGYLLKSDGKFHEKGVDVNMAVDMLVATYENTCHRIILVSSDTDLLPAVKKAREKGKKVEYIGFSHQPSVAMVANCSSSRLLTKEELSQFVKK